MSKRQMRSQAMDGAHCTTAFGECARAPKRRSRRLLRGWIEVKRTDFGAREAEGSITIVGAHGSAHVRVVGAKAVRDLVTGLRVGKQYEVVLREVR